jgi:hypothetical protein
MDSSAQDKPGKAPKERKQTAEERLAALRYNQLMYGRTTTERKLQPKRVDYGASFLKHPKFQELVGAFRKGAADRFEVRSEGGDCTVATDAGQITFNGKVLFYSRPSGKQVDHLYLERASAVQLQGNEVAVHLVFAVLRSFQELGEHGLLYLYHKFYQGPESLDSGPSGPGTNLDLGTYKHNRPHERTR